MQIYARKRENANFAKMKRLLMTLVPVFMLVAACGGADPDPAVEPGGKTEKPEEPGEPGGPENPEEPPVDESLVCIDAPLLLEVPAGAELGAAGYIRVFDDLGVEADAINLADLSGVTVREEGARPSPSA